MRIDGKQEGDPFQIAEHLTEEHDAVCFGRGFLSPIARPSADSGQRKDCLRVDRSGKEIDKEVYPDNLHHSVPSLSHDGRRVAVFPVCERKRGHLVGTKGAVARGTGSRSTRAMTSIRCGHRMAARIVFSSHRRGHNLMNLYWNCPQRPAGK